MARNNNTHGLFWQYLGRQSVFAMTEGTQALYFVALLFWPQGC